MIPVKGGQNVYFFLREGGRNVGIKISRLDYQRGGCYIFDQSPTLTEKELWQFH